MRMVNSTSGHLQISQTQPGARFLKANANSELDLWTLEDFSNPIRCVTLDAWRIIIGTLDAEFKLCCYLSCEFVVWALADCSNPIQSGA